jgi:hypothetical protein
VLACCAATALAQYEGELTAQRRILPEIGPGLRAVKHGADGRLYVLASPSPGLAVYDAKGTKIFAIGASSAHVVASKAAAAQATIVFGEDCDVDPSGLIYVADRGANLIRIFSPEGTPLRSIAVNAPVSVAALPQGELAVATLREPELVIVFDKNGREVRDFGDLEAITDRAELNRYLNIGSLASDAQGHLFYAFAYMPEPTVRQYDRHGYAQQDIRYTAIDAMPAAQAIRKEIERQERRGNEPFFKRIVTAAAVDPASGEVWLALYNTLLHFDKEGNRRASYQLYTPTGGRLEAAAILVEKDRILVGGDNIGIYQFARPEKLPQP